MWRKPLVANGILFIQGERMSPKRIFHCVLFVCFSLLIVSSFSGRAGAAITMPEFSLPSAVDGKIIKSKSFEGKAMLITFFATWCPPCRQEIPTLIQVHKEYGPQGFAVIGLSVDEGGAKLVAKLVEQQKINYPVLMANRATAKDFGGVAGIPTSFLVNKKGHVVKKYPGFVPHALLERDIKAVLQ
jgi:thiol-disulfide isomerase/thioredoxin